MSEDQLFLFVIRFKNKTKVATLGKNYQKKYNNDNFDEL